MNGKLIINTNLLRKEPEYRTNSCVVEKTAAVFHAGFESDHIQTLSQTQKQESTEQIAAEEIEEEIQMDISM